MKTVKKFLLTVAIVMSLVLMTLSLMVQLMILNQLQTGHTEINLSPLKLLPAKIVLGT